MPLLQLLQQYLLIIAAKPLPLPFNFNDGIRLCDNRGRIVALACAIGFCRARVSTSTSSPTRTTPLLRAIRFCPKSTSPLSSAVRNRCSVASGSPEGCFCPRSD